MKLTEDTSSILALGILVIIGSAITSLILSALFFVFQTIVEKEWLTFAEAFLRIWVFILIFCISSIAILIFQKLPKNRKK